jgi:hypothetical protein
MTDLPGPKSEWDGVSTIGAHPEMWITNAEYNIVRQAMFDLRAAILALSGGGGGATALFDVEFTGSTITFGPSVSPWDPGTDYGSVTLIHCVTDGSSRNVNQISIRNAVHGSVICLKSENTSGSPRWQHLQGGDGQMKNSGGIEAAGGGVNGSIWYWFNEATTPKQWEEIMSTSGT